MTPSSVQFHAHAHVNILLSGSSDKLLPTFLLPEENEGQREGGTHQPQS